MSDDAEYWKRVACWLADVTAATAYHQIHLKSTGKGEKERQANIARIAAKALSGAYCPQARDAETIIERLREVTA